MTNGDKIRSMSDEDLAYVILCPYDCYGSENEKMPCVKNGIQEMVEPAECHKCSVEWLGKKVRK